VNRAASIELSVGGSMMWRVANSSASGYLVGLTAAAALSPVRSRRLVEQFPQQSMSFVAESVDSPLAVAVAARRHVRELDPGLPLS
jgi:hypothetical protein